MLGKILEVSFSLLIVQGYHFCHADLNRIYTDTTTSDEPTPFCINGTDTIEISNFTEEELINRCGSFKYVEFENCDVIRCCNETEKEHHKKWSLVTNAEESRLCDGSLYGVANDDGISTIFDMGNAWYKYYIPDISVEYEYVGCILEDALKYMDKNDEASSTTSQIISLKRENPYVPAVFKYINPDTTRFRIWDFFGRCHIEFHTTNETFPIGIPVGSNTSIPYIPVVSLYVEPGFNWTSLIIPAVADFDQKDFIESTIDRFFHQFVEVLGLGEDNIILSDDDMNLTDSNLNGYFECVTQCRNLSHTSDLILVHSNFCYCTTYEAIPNILQINPGEYHQCPNNPNMSCGGMGSTTVYHLNPDFGSDSNFGYKFWQAIQYPAFYNYQTIMNNSEIPYASISTIDSASRCLGFCKEDDFEIAIISASDTDDDDDTFECFCMYPEFYKFTWQDISIHKLDYWCPDLDGPCVSFEDKDVNKYAVVYCMDEACDVDMIMNPTDQELCEIGTKIAHPKDDLSDYYFECTKEDSIHSKFTRKPCETPDHFFYPSIGICAESNCTIGDQIAFENCSNIYAQCEKDHYSQSGGEENVWNLKECPEGLWYSNLNKTCNQYCDGDNHWDNPWDCKGNETHCNCLDEWFGVDVFWEVKRGQNGTKLCSIYSQKGRNFVGGNYYFYGSHINYK